MKYLKLVIAFCILIAVCIGCASAKKTAYTTLASVGMAVDKAMVAAADAKVAGLISDADWQKIAAAHAKYRVAYSTACDLAGADLTQFSPAQVTNLAFEIINLVNSLKK